MMTVLIPAKAFARSKQRLAPVLSPAERAALATGLLHRTIKVTASALPESRIIVAAEDDTVARAALSAGADRAIACSGRGLNADLAEAAASVPRDHALMVIHTDLPLLAAADLQALAAQEAPLTLCPDAGGHGTNAALFKTAQRFFHFGEDSRARHQRAAAQRGLSCHLLKRSGLANDLDMPEDWRRFAKIARPLMQVKSGGNAEPCRDAMPVANSGLAPCS